MGRRSKLTPAVQATILQYIRGGNYVSVAVKAAGIHQSQFYRWLNNPRPMYRAFREAVEKAEADAEARHVAIVSNAASKTWQAAAWWLERKYSDRWGQKQAKVDARDLTPQWAADAGLDPEEVMIAAEELVRSGQV